MCLKHFPHFCTLDIIVIRPSCPHDPGSPPCGPRPITRFSQPHWHSEALRRHAPYCHLPDTLSFRREIALQFRRKEVTSHLQPRQLGVGVACGAEAIIHSIQCYVSRYMSDNHMIAQLDRINAFNCVSRQATLAAVHEACPYILSWTPYAMCSCSHLYFVSYLLSSSFGVKHGNPRSPMFFTLAIHPHVSQLSSVPDVDLFALNLDDGTLASSQQGD